MKRKKTSRGAKAIWPYGGKEEEDMTEEREELRTWAILELMGHRKLGGFVSEAAIGGASFIRIDVPGGPEPAVEPMGTFIATQYYAPAAVYCITPTTEETARALARTYRPEPVTRWELPPAPKSERRLVDAEYDPGRVDGPDNDDEDEVPA